MNNKILKQNQLSYLSGQNYTLLLSKNYNSCVIYVLLGGWLGFSQD